MSELEIVIVVAFLVGVLAPCCVLMAKTGGHPRPGKPPNVDEWRRGCEAYRRRERAKR